jgi:hypothetical protein
MSIISDIFQGWVSQLDSPATRQFVIVPQDGVNLSVRPRAIKILTAGNIAIVDELGVSQIYPVSAGDLLTFRAVQVPSTGTTATAVAWY